jgi:hypothetical protein
MDPIRTDREPASCVSADVGSAPLPRGGRPVSTTAIGGRPAARPHAMFLTSDAVWLLGQLLAASGADRAPEFSRSSY